MNAQANLASENTESGSACIVPDLPNADYHASEAIGSSQLKSVLSNPHRFRHECERPSPATAAMNLGSLVHSLVLEPHRLDAEYLIIDASTRSTKAYKAAAEGAGGRLPILRHELETAQAMADAAHADPWVAELIKREARIEQSVFWQEQGMELKARPDWWAPDLGIMVDVKTTADASPESFTRSVIKFGYDLSAAHYLLGAAAVGLPTDTFVWIAIESAPPHTVQVYIASDEFLERGRILRDRAVERLRECREKNEWPGYADEPIELTPPAWALLEEGL